jgi:hypothetical protein
VTSNGCLLQELPKLFDLLGGDSLTVYLFLTQHHPELEGDTALSSLQRGKISRVQTAAENASGRFSWSVPRSHPGTSSRATFQLVGRLNAKRSLLAGGL